ncbi:DNA-binding transcriptional regulator [Escherichia coli]|nr:DNA-binding transcriptional regulator [Escherichia coli]SQT87712.1 DNA-binding transcriptional regulator [Escherichia coli]
MKAYWDSLTKEQQGELAGKVGSTPGYLRLVFNGYKKASFVLAKKLEQCTSGAITKSDLRPDKHPCEKPADMLRQIINASSRPGDLVADFFMGSGSTIKAAMALGRRALGVELESERFNQTVKEVSELVGK